MKEEENSYLDDEEDLDLEGTEKLLEKKKPSKVLASLPNRKLKTFAEVYESEEILNFLIPNVLPESGLVYFGGASAVGKSIIAIQLVVGLVLDKPILRWKPTEGIEQVTALMLSLEMNELECRDRIRSMYPTLSDEEKKILENHFFIYSDPEPFQLWNSAHVIELINLIKNSSAKVILLDSATVSFANSLNDDSQVNESLNNLYAIRARLNVAFVVVAHTRKLPSGISSSPEDVTINDMMGHSGIVQWASSIFLMVEDEKVRKKAIKDGSGDETDKLVHIINVKTRFGSSNAAFTATLPSKKSTSSGVPLQFKGRDAIPLPPVTQSRKKQKESPMASLMKDFDFSSLDDEDDL